MKPDYCFISLLQITDKLSSCALASLLLQRVGRTSCEFSLILNSFHFSLLKPWPNGLASQRKFAKPELCTDLRRVAKQIRKSTQLAKGRRFIHLQMTCDHFVLTCFGWPNGRELASTCVRISGRLSQCKDHASRWPSETQLKTCVDLRVRFVRPLNNYNFYVTINQKLWECVGYFAPTHNHGL